MPVTLYARFSSHTILYLRLPKFLGQSHLPSLHEFLGKRDAHDVDNTDAVEMMRSLARVRR